MLSLGKQLKLNEKGGSPYIQELMEARKEALNRDFRSLIDTITNDVRNKGLSAPLKYRTDDITYYLRQFSKNTYRLVHDDTPVYQATAPRMFHYEKQEWNKMLKEHDLFMYHEHHWWTHDTYIEPITRWNLIKVWWMTH